MANNCTVSRHDLHTSAPKRTWVWIARGLLQKQKRRAQGRPLCFVVLLGRHIWRKRASRLDFPAQPAGRSIETIRPRWWAILKEYPREICRVAQGLDHRATVADDGRKIKFARHTVAERRAQTISADTFYFRNLNHHPDPRSWRAAYRRAPGANEACNRHARCQPDRECLLDDEKTMKWTLVSNHSQRFKHGVPKLVSRLHVLAARVFIQKLLN
jgi:hypothetical protein